MRETFWRTHIHHEISFSRLEPVTIESYFFAFK